MRSATREALASTSAVLTDLGDTVTAQVGEEILASGRAIGSAPQLLTLFADATADATGKQVLIGRVFSAQAEATRAVLVAVAGSRWSSASDLLAGIESAGIRAIARSAEPGVSISGELLAFEATVRSDSGLELGLGAKLGSTGDKAKLVERLLGGKASRGTVAIVSHLVQQPRGRRISEVLRDAAALVAQESGSVIATVTSATSLSEAQSARIARVLGDRYGRTVSLNTVVDPAIVGGVRVEVGGDVIDGTLSTRLSDLKLQLAV